MNSSFYINGKYKNDHLIYNKNSAEVDVAPALGKVTGVPELG